MLNRIELLGEIEASESGVEEDEYKVNKFGHIWNAIIEGTSQIGVSALDQPGKCCLIVGSVFVDLLRDLSRENVLTAGGNGPQGRSETVYSRECREHGV